MEQIKPTPQPKSTDFTRAQHFGQLLDSDNALVGIKDLEHRYLFANGNLEVMHGFSSGGLFGVKSEALVRNEHIAEEIYARENYVARIVKPTHFIERLHIKDKLHVWHTIRFPFFDQNGLIIGTGFIAIDNEDDQDMTRAQQDTLEQARKKILFLSSRSNNPSCISTGMPNKADPDHVESGALGQINLNWSKIYECGNPTIDQQHQELCEQAQQLRLATLDSKPKTEIVQLVESLLNKIRQHFHDEENILRKALFPHTGEHHKLHATIIASATTLAQQFKEDKFNQGDLISFLVYDVLLWHMLEEDRKFYAFIDPYFPLTADT